MQLPKCEARVKSVSRGKQRVPRIDEIWVNSCLQAIRGLSVDVIQAEFALTIYVFAHVVETTLRRLQYKSFFVQLHGMFSITFLWLSPHHVILSRRLHDPSIDLE